MSEVSSAWRLLGLAADATADDVRAARRRLAKEFHPDVAGGDADAMRELNEAVAVVLAEIASAAGSGPVGSSAAAPTFRRQWQGRTQRPRRPSGGFRQHVTMPVGRDAVAHDTASFVIEALPVDAFEALLVVTSWIGEVISDEPPYQLDVLMTDPIRCWCRLDLVPDAGASTLSITIARLPRLDGADEPDLPDIDDVRDLWVDSLNHLGADPE